jgi:NAD(P)-dependent dehydrogenase (short-subunit alcohol dehydrogenase family)
VVVLLSGGGSGLGRAVAIEMTAVGATVVICGRRAAPLRETVALCPPGRCEAQECDVRDEEQVDRLVDDVVARHHRVDVLVNNAGGQFLAAAEEITPKGFRTVMRLNAESAWLMTHAVAKRSMIPAGRGKVINVTLSPHAGLPGMAHSTASRAAVEALTRVLSIEWARFGITLNAVAVGHFASETFMSKYPAAVVDEAARTVPLQRLGRPEEAAWLMTYLASGAADYLSGAVLAIDGGRNNWRGTFPTPEYRDADGNVVAEARRTQVTT